MAEELLESSAGLRHLEKVRRGRRAAAGAGSGRSREDARVQAAGRGRTRTVRRRRRARERDARHGATARGARPPPAERDEPPAALASDVHVLAVGVDVGEVECDGLGRAETTGVDEFHERGVAQREWVVAVEVSTSRSTSASFGVSGRRRACRGASGASGTREGPRA